MIGIILTILRIIGTVIAWLLAVLIFLLLLVVFTPIRSEFSGHYYSHEDYGIRVKFTYLMHIVSFMVAFDGGLDLSFRIFGFDINKAGKVSKDDAALDDSINQSEESKKKKAKKNKGTDKKSEKKSRLNNDTDGGITKNDIGYLVLFFIRQLLYLLNELKPQKVKADIDFGFENPAHTGWLVAGLSMISWTLWDGVNIRPDFQSDKNFVYGSAEIKCRLRIFILVIIGIRVLRDRQVRKLLNL